MTTLAQCIYKTAHPNMSHDFENNEHFEEFRDGLLNVAGMSVEKLDTVMIDILGVKPKDEPLSSGTIYRRSHKLLRDVLKRDRFNLINVQRFLLNKLYYYSQQLEEEIDEDLVQKWESQIDPHLKKLDSKSGFETLLGVFAKVLTLSPTGKTMLTYLGAGKKKQEEDIEETDDFNDNSTGFEIPKSRQSN